MTILFVFRSFEQQYFITKLFVKNALTFLLKAQILSHSIVTTDFDDPCAIMNDFRPSTVMPRRRTPRTVGKRGSSLKVVWRAGHDCPQAQNGSLRLTAHHPSTYPLSTMYVSFRLLSTVFCRLRRLEKRGNRTFAFWYLMFCLTLHHDAILLVLSISTLSTSF